MNTKNRAKDGFSNEKDFVKKLNDRACQVGSSTFDGT